MSKNPKVVSFDRSAAYLHHRAMMNRRDNHHVDALELMRRAVEAQPENSEYRLDLAELYCEMGCHQQSSRLLLDMLSEKDAPSECFYGLALNQLGMNDLTGAKQSLSIYRKRDPQGVHFEDVRMLAAELDYYTQMSRPANRRLNRAMRVANRACDALRDGDAARACRLFRRTLDMASEQYEMRALYAVALMMSNRDAEARTEAERASGGFPPSARALCVSAQVYHMLEDEAQALALMAKAEQNQPDGQELRLMLYSAGEMGMHEKAAEYARLALQETPYDRELLHARAVALALSGADKREAARCWERILRLDPEDSVALYYRELTERDAFDGADLQYAYEVPEAEFTRRLAALSQAMGEGIENIGARWREDADFRRLVRWGVYAQDPRLGRAAMTVLATLEDDSARSVLRELMFAPEVSRNLKLHAAVLMKLQERPLSEILPQPMDAMGEALVDAEEILSELPVGDRQLVRFASEVLEREYSVSALPVLALMWQSYRRMRGMRGDPLQRIESAAAALAWNYLLATGEKPEVGRLARQFGCGPRQMAFCAARIAGTLEQPTRNE